MISEFRIKYRFEYRQNGSRLPNITRDICIPQLVFTNYPIKGFAWTSFH